MSVFVKSFKTIKDIKTLIQYGNCNSKKEKKAQIGYENYGSYLRIGRLSIQPLKMMQMFTSMSGCSLCIVIEIEQILKQRVC